MPSLRLIAAQGVTFALLQTAFVQAQPGSGGPPPLGGGGDDTSSGESCDQCGASATYSETISTSSSGLTTRDITTNGCPNHYSICTGKNGLTGCGGVGNEGTASEAKMNSADGDGSTTLSIPATPVFASSTTDIECDMGSIAIALNGVGIFTGAVNTDCDLVGWLARLLFACVLICQQCS